MQNIINQNYYNEDEKELSNKFLYDKTVKKYILGINKLTKSVLKHVEIDGVIDDFTRVQTSRKKEILQIDKDSKLIASSGYSNSKVLSEYQNYGFINSLPKPYKLNELLEIIKLVNK